MALVSSINKKFFTRTLLSWNLSTNTRLMPWKSEKDPYKIWLSEIILQQTRVAQGTEYYNKFIKSFPTVHDLAGAEEQEVYKHWEGLGYYSRCKNLLATAKVVSAEMEGKFPGSYDGLLNLKGIGSYTASAIASFAFGLPNAVVDGNVYRVLSRFFGISHPIDSTEGKKVFAKIAGELLDKDEPAAYNQAIMDFGAEVCKPSSPNCGNCPLSLRCFAFNEGAIDKLPVKHKTITVKNRYFNYLVINHKGSCYVRKRTGRDIWQNLFEFVMIETNEPVSLEELKRSPAFKNVFNSSKIKVEVASPILKQKLTHQLIHAQFITINANAPMEIEGYERMAVSSLRSLPFPKIISTYLKD
jgi:A/G-specific adenine glycosylase